ncbi:hypothetical protein OA15_09805 [Vibrio vulnificus]|nr:hypothetical protein OA15_09805 [Vibrio vulnificus]KHF88042.1 hypothetical protein OA19_08850 [Vibrio vulnificus]KHF91968.1 hypothetical protein OA16_08240 [Vibrio vulnificus]KHF96066.1 hypothetical protein OA14_07140 [Vibrio vulnificus]
MLTLKFFSFDRFREIDRSLFKLLLQAKCDGVFSFNRNLHHTDTNAKSIMVMLEETVVLSDCTSAGDLCEVAYGWL